MSDHSASELGRKVFFLYPPSVIRDDLVELIARNEYEVYLFDDHTHAASLLSSYPGVILFVNLDDGMREEAWDSYVRELIASPPAEDVRIGVLTGHPTEELGQKYLLDIGVQCGFVGLKLEVEQSARIILRTLAANEAKGKRKHVRAAGLQMATFNVRQGAADAATGTVLNISAAGMACEFDAPVSFKVGHVFEDVQLILRGARTTARAHVIAMRPGQTPEAQPAYVFVFDHRGQGQRVAQRIQTFVYQALQINMQRQLQSLQES